MTLLLILLFGFVYYFELMTQVLEKMIGGMYIGQLVCKVFNAAADAGEVLQVLGGGGRLGFGA